jgi:LmbE family N-acetylglucosaminyl deacetylase
LFLALLLGTGLSASAQVAAAPALASTLRVLQVTAHPGDEDGALLLYEVRAQGAQVVLLTLTRGERGENRNAIMAPSEQGLLRTMEQLASDTHYGVEQRFTRVVDFGFARTAAEVFDRWGGHNAALADIVRVIRETHPDIIVTPYAASAPDGDGQHEATAILAREAFRAAADAKKFPEQLSNGIANGAADGLEPWQAKRLFALSLSAGDSVAFNAADSGTGEHASWQQQAQLALAARASQQGAWHGLRGAVRHYRLIDSAPGFGLPQGATGLADGLDTGLEALADAVELGSAETASPETTKVRAYLKAMRESVTAGCEEREQCVAQLAAYLRNLRAVEDRMLVARSNAQRSSQPTSQSPSRHSTQPPAWLRSELEAKRKQAEQALLLAANLSVQARLIGDELGEKMHDEKRGELGDGKHQAPYVLTPGATFAVEVQVLGAGAHVVSMELKPEGGRWAPRREWSPGDTHAIFRGRVPADAPFTRPTFLLESEVDGTYRILDERNATRALPPPPLQAVVELEVAGELVRASAPVESARPAIAESRPVMIAPPLSVIVEPRTHWNRRTYLSYGEIEVRVRSNLASLGNALLSVHPPSGWRAEPEHEVLEIEGRGEEHGYRFFLVQERGGAGSFPVRAVVRWGGTVYDQGYTIVRGPGEQVAFDYRTSMGSLASAAVDVPEGLEIGYVGVAGDPIPATLRDIGVKVTELSREELMPSQPAGRPEKSLAKHWAIVLGNHAVDSRPELAEARTALLDYAAQGGVLVILAQSDAARFSANAPLPYPLELSSPGAGTARVSNPASPLERIEPHDPLFWDPNEIGDDDFGGWSEERGQCFAQRWDAHYEPLLRMNDPGQPTQLGSLLRARYGRGYVIYTGLSFTRQLPAGVPGALRLLINLLSPGAELHR